MGAAGRLCGEGSSADRPAGPARIVGGAVAAGPGSENPPVWWGVSDVRGGGARRGLDVGARPVALRSETRPEWTVASVRLVWTVVDRFVVRGVGVARLGSRRRSVSTSSMSYHAGTAPSRPPACCGPEVPQQSANR
ncbi:hypothetical protein GCM10023108_53010 [Saccharopolyspora hordei]